MAPGLTRDTIDSPANFDVLSSFSAGSDNSLGRSESELEQDVLEPLAVVGFSFKFPQDATSTESFWNMLSEGRCASTEIPKSRMNIDAFYCPGGDRQGSLPLRGAHFIQDNIGAFDAPFFSISPTEAAALDPQQRGLLETAYRALENAGMPMENILGSNTSVYTGCFTADYAHLVAKDPERMPKYTAIGTAATMLSNRISWFFNLKGNSVTLDSACSSSLVALDSACQGLWNGNSSMALVAGCNLIYSPDMTIGLSSMSFLSPDSRCYSFDHRANGYARGEGFGVVVIKRLIDAVRDGDSIRAVIRSTCSNQDGRTQSITQPSKESQADLIQATYARAGLDLQTTRYFEAHGTGTPIGDPIEAGAIGAAFKNVRSPEQPLYIGALKSNIGHLEGCAGIAGLIKAILALERGIIPPNTNFEHANPQIDAKFLNIEFPMQSLPWPTSGLRRASVNSFGFGGTNSHVILDDAYNSLCLRNLTGNHCTVKEPPSQDDLERAFKTSFFTLPTIAYGDIPEDEIAIQPTGKLLVLSAADERALKRMTVAYTQLFNAMSLDAQAESTYLTNLSYTLDTRRSSLPWKAFALIHSCLELRQLETIMSKPVKPTINPKLGFIFTGQGAQWHAMGRELLVYPVFKSSLLRAESYLHTLGCEWSLLDELLKDETNTRINNPDLSQPLCTAVQVALVDLLRSFQVLPAAVVGHSSGEIAAAYSIGAISCQSAWKIAYFRGNFAARLENSSVIKGAMLSVGLSETQVQPYLEMIEIQPGYYGLTVSCVNSPKNVTVAGDSIHIDKLQTVLAENHIFMSRLRVNVSYHSPQMFEVASEYGKCLNDIGIGEFVPKNASMVSSVTGKIISRMKLLENEYWVQNLVSPVRFSDALTRICSQSAQAGRKKLDGSHRHVITVHDLLELGPHSALKGPVREILEGLHRTEKISYQSILIRHRSALETLLDACGHLYCRGYPVHLGRINRPSMKRSPQPALLTSLPEYPFDHSQTYWHEGSVSKGLRFRKHPHHPLLGAPAMDWNSLEGRWRHILRMSEHAWMGDHKISGSILYPAAGMVVMAIEAVRQLAEDRNIIAFVIKDAIFHKPLKFLSNLDEVETEFYLRPLRDSSDRNNEQCECRLYVHQDGDWIETFRGNIQVIYEPAYAEFDGGKEAEEELLALKRRHDQAAIDCKNAVEPQVLYQTLHRLGYNYGPTFRLINWLQYSENGEAIGDVNLSHSFLPNTGIMAHSHVIHPTTLDGVLQLALASLTKGGTSSISTTIPTRINRLWLSNTRFDSSYSDPGRAYAKVTNIGRRVTESTISVLSKTTQDLLVHIEGFQTTAVENSQIEPTTEPIIKQLCYHVDWQPDPDIMSQEELMQYCRDADVLESDPIEFFHDLAILKLKYISQALEKISSEGIKPSADHLQRYVMWMLSQQDRILAEGPARSTSASSLRALHDANDVETLARKVESKNKQGELVVRTGRNLIEILRGKVDPLSLLFADNLLREYYLEGNQRSSGFRRFGKYLSILANKYPGMRILEVGAGTGATTEMILGILDAEEQEEARTPRYSRYDFTDVSSSFLAEAQNFFTNRTGMTFAILNIEQDPLQQNFRAESYDLIVAAHVLHATTTLNQTVQNLRRVLRPGGKLILAEVTRPGILGADFTFGLLAGWWLGTEDYRLLSPCITEHQWHEVLLENGFSGTDLVFHDYESDACHEWSIIVSTATEAAISKPHLSSIKSPRKLIITDSRGDLVIQKISLRMQDEFASMGFVECKILTLDDAAASSELQGSYCVFLGELEQPILRDLDTKSFAAIQSVLLSAAKVLWVTGGGGKSPPTPDFGMVTGLSRVLRTENPTIVMVTLALDFAGNRMSICLRNIINIFCSAILRSTSEGYEAEYLERDGLLHINRVIEDRHLDRKISVKCSKEQYQQQKIAACPPLKLSIQTPGLLDTLCFVEDEEYMKPLGPKEVEVEVKVAGLNFRDCLIALSPVDADAFGTECAGIVTRVGEGCSLPVGARVSVCGANSFRRYQRCIEELVIPIEDGLSFAEAASLPTNFITAYYSLCDVARLQKEESILIHAAAGGTGQAAIQIAQYLGATIYVTVGSVNKKILLIERYNLPEAHVLYSRDTSFVKGIRRLTRGRGVDVVLNSLADQGLVASWECIAPFGRFIEIGKKDIQLDRKLPMSGFSKNVSFSAVDVYHMMLKRPYLVRKPFLAVLKLLAAKLISTVQPLHVYPVSQIKDAFRFMQSGKSTGKIVLDLTENALVPVILTTRPTYCFEGNATYVISGGLGGLGRSISRWMASRGANHLLLLSRYGPVQPAAVELLKELAEKGVQVEAPACDVTNASSLEGVLRKVEQTMPPIRGCIQGSMVLKDAVFQSMSLEDWKACIQPKVHGSWNLHVLLPQNLDFFILLSSVCGIIGQGGQANYAAASTYLDSLVDYRISKGQKATSLDLGPMLSEGLLAENKDLMNRITRTGALSAVSQQELFALLDLYCDPELELSTPTLSEYQIITGITAPASLQANGVEEPSWMQQSIFRHLHHGKEIAAASFSPSSIDLDPTSLNFATAITSMPSMEAAGSMVAQELAKRAAKILGIPISTIDLDKPMHSYGLDSLVAVELRNWLAKEIGADIAIFEISGGASFSRVGLSAAGKSRFRPATWMGGGDI